MLRKFHAALAMPVIYDGFQRFMKRDEVFNRLVQDFLKPQAGMHVLDLGCGTGRLMDYITVPLHYKGYDLSSGYIAQAQARYGSRGTYVVGSVPDCLLQERGSYDLIFAMGLLHHISDEVVMETLHHVKRLLKPGGRFISFDCTYAEGQPWLARKMIDADRGEHVRLVDAYLALVAPHFSQVESTVAHNWARLPYTHLIITAAV